MYTYIVYAAVFRTYIIGFTVPDSNFLYPVPEGHVTATAIIYFLFPELVGCFVHPFPATTIDPRVSVPVYAYYALRWTRKDYTG